MIPRFIQAVLRNLAAEPATSDCDLLRRFLGGDDSAFVEIVRRQGRLVWTVCRNLTRSDAEADDAFQATFLVLLRNARSIRDGNRLSSWLHGTAYRLCRRARRAADRRENRERVAAARESCASAVPDSAWDRTLTAIHEEAGQLPEALRVPFVLCCLEGKSVTEAAHQLGWKLGTLSGRLTRAKAVLLARLDVRGLAVGAVAGIGLATPSSSVVAEAAALVQVGYIVPKSVIQLTHGTIGMTATSVKTLTAALLLTCGLGLAAGNRWMATAEAQQAAPAGSGARQELMRPVVEQEQAEQRAEAQPPPGSKQESYLADQPTPPAATPGDSGGVKRNQEENLKLFKRFSEEVLRLAQKWEKSDSNEDKERAKSLRGALKLIEEKGVEKLFKGLVEGLGSKGLEGSDFEQLLGKDKKLIAALEEILEVLNTEDESARLKAEIENLKKAIAAIQKLKREQENVRARTDGKKGDPDKLAEDQKDLASKTQDVANALNKGNKDSGKPIAQEVQQAVPQQQGAEEDIKGGKNNEASKKQDKAIEHLEKTLAELEKRLKQLREKEQAKLLQNLEERVGRMLRMQMEVKASTEGIDKTVKALGGKPAVAEIQKSQAQADRESAIVAEAEKTLKLMEGEGSAVVFAGVLSQVKGDMEAIQKRLNEARVGEDTQQIEQDVIDQFKMMQEALKKAQKDLENKPSDSNAKKPDSKLLDHLAELKLLKYQQEILNRRTIMHNKQDPGEQAKDALIQAELNRLGTNQKELQEMLHKIATKANQ